MSGASMTRFHELDALRAFAMLLGVVLHASLFLVTKDWPIVGKEISPDLPYDDIVLAIHGFRMPVFFLLSGFFTAMLWQRRGAGSLIAHRLKRVGLPLLIGAFTIIPIHVYLILMLTEADLTLAGVIWIFLLSWLDNLHHLWFLWVLLILVGIFVGLSSAGAKFTHRYFWWLLIPLVIVPQLMMVEDTWGADTSSTVFINPVVLGYYLCFFIFGTFMYQTDLKHSSWWTWALIALIPVFYVGLHFEFVSKEPWAEMASAVLQVAYAWTACFGLMGLFKIVASTERKWIRYLSDASYWIYLCHLALIFPAQALATKLDLNLHLEVLLIIVAAPAILLIIYHFGVRYTWIGTMLNGPRERYGKSEQGYSHPQSKAPVALEK